MDLIEERPYHYTETTIFGAIMTMDKRTLIFQPFSLANTFLTGFLSL